MYKRITEKQFENEAKKQGVSNPKAFAMFMKARFPNEFDWRYTREWIGRFKTGNPERYMDSESLRAYAKVKKLV